MTSGASRGAQWSVGPNPVEAPGRRLSDLDPNGAADAHRGAPENRGVRPALADHSGRAARHGPGASGHHRHRADLSGARG
jgi:hypothetical protein